MEFAVNVLSLVFQAGIVGWLTRRGSVALSLSAMPLLLGASFVVLALLPLGGVFLVTQVIRRAADYGLGKPPREMLFTVLNPESKFKSKSLIDTVLQRGSDVMSQWLYRGVAGLGSAGIAWLCAGISVLLLGATRTLGRTFETRRRSETRRERGPMPAQRIDAAGKVHVDLPAILRLAAPLMATNAVQALLNLTDLWFIGRLSTDALAAMSAIYWICQLRHPAVRWRRPRRADVRRAGLRQPPQGACVSRIVERVVGVAGDGAGLPRAGLRRAWLLASSACRRTCRHWRSSTGCRASAARSSA
ncbi:MAG: hypothetical protein QM747_13530 [Nocardioides sp.]